MPAGGYGLFQRGECRGLRQGGDRTADRHGPSAASSAVGRALRSGAGSAARSNAGRGDGASADDAGRPGALRVAQADAGAGVRDHQIGAGFPSVFAARLRGRARRMEPRHHGLEHQADIRLRPRLTRPSAPALDRLPPANAHIRPRTPFRRQSPDVRQTPKAPKSFSAINRKPESDRLLASRLDAEDWRNLVNAYLDQASAAVTGLGGHVLKKLGDGLMALFGYPHAQENDAERAVRAALAIQRALVRQKRQQRRPGAFRADRH